MRKESGPKIDYEEIHIMKDLSRDVFLSFKYSQGDTELQDLLLLYAGKNFLLHNPHAGLKQTQKFQNYINNMQLPGYHAQKFDTGEDIMKSKEEIKLPELGETLDLYMKLLNMMKKGKTTEKGPATASINFDLYKFYTAGDETIVREIALRELKRDIKYMKEGRPNRQQFEMDPFESYVKTYALEQKPSHSPGFDSLFQSMHDLILTPDLPVTDYFYLPPQKTPVKPFSEGIANQLLLERLNELSERWEQRHPGKQFI